MGLKLDLSARQARVGIIANPQTVPPPIVLPRDVMARWPDLRSKRRMRKLGQLDVHQDDMLRADMALANFAQEIRQSVRRDGWGQRFGDFLRRPFGLP